MSSRIVPRPLVADRARSEVTAQDRARYRGVQLASSSALLLAFALGSALQANVLNVSGVTVPAVILCDVWGRLIANLAAVLVVVAGIAIWPTIGLRWPAKTAILLGLGVLGSVVRAFVQLLVGVHSLAQPTPLVDDAFAPALTGAIALAAGLGAAEITLRLGRQERLHAAQAARAAHALRQLQDEELRVRKEVAEGLHGSLQQHLVIAEAELARLREQLVTGGPRLDDIALVDSLARRLAAMREDDVRGYSQMLYPVGLDTGLPQAIRAVFQRLPATIAVSLQLDASLQRADDPGDPLPVAFRVTVIRLVEEGVTNALRHGHATSVAADLSVDQHGRLRVVLDDNGSGPASSDAGSWSGLLRLSHQLAQYGGSLELVPSPLGGARLEASVPLPDVSENPAANATTRPASRSR